MKKRIVLLLLIIGSIWAYCHPEESRAFFGKASQYAATQMLKLSHQWSPPSPSVVEEKLPEMPPGTYVLRETITPAPGSGGAPVLLGADLRKIGEGNGKVMLTSGTTQVIVDADQLTRDPKEAAALKMRAQELQRSQMNETRARLDLQLTKVAAEIGIATAELNNLRSKEAYFKTRGRGLPMGTSADLVQQRLTRLEAQSADLKRQIALTTPAPLPAESVTTANPK